jgi:hypothetical protein
LYAFSPGIVGSSRRMTNGWVDWDGQLVHF